jgi:hypothetical protein
MMEWRKHKGSTGSVQSLLYLGKVAVGVVWWEKLREEDPPWRARISLPGVAVERGARYDTEEKAMEVVERGVRLALKRMELEGK